MGLFLFNMYFIYILYSERSDLYYIGYTGNWERRFEEHNNSKSSTFTCKHRPWIPKAVYFCGNDEASAIRIERFIKKSLTYGLIEHLILVGSPVYMGLL